MKKVQCLKCSGTWYGDDKDISNFRLCPFCGVGNLDREKIEIADTLDRALYRVCAECGVDIFNNHKRLCAYLMDISSGIDRELRIFSRIFDKEYADVLFELFSNTTDGQRVLQELKVKFMDYEGLTEQWADFLCQSILKAYDAHKNGGYIKYNFEVSDLKTETSPFVKKKSNVKATTSAQSSDTWTCPNCGKAMPNYVGTCACGEIKPFDFDDYIPNVPVKYQTVSQQTAHQKTPTKTTTAKTSVNAFGKKKIDIGVTPLEQRTDVWTCPNCGKVMPNYVGTCGCGEVKPFDFGD